MHNPSKLQWLLFLVSIAVFVALTSNAPKLKISSGWTDHLTPRTDSAIGKLKVDTFLGGAKEYSQFFLFTDTQLITSNSTLDAIEFITDQIEASGLFERGAIKAINYNRQLSISDQNLDASKYVERDELPLTPEAQTRLKESIEASNHIYGTLVSNDFHSTRIIAIMERKSGDGISGHQWRSNLINAVREKFGIRLVVLDDVFVNSELDQKVINDTSIWPGLALLAIVIVCYFLCGRKWYHVVGLLLLTGMTLSSLLGLIVLLGFTYHVMFVFIPILLIVAASSDYPYFALRDYYQSPTLFLSVLAVPITLSALTTSVSAGSLIIAEIDQIQQFGIVACSGILLNSLYSLTVIPVYFYLLKVVGVEREITKTESFVFRPLVESITFLHTRKGVQGATVAVVALISLAFLPMAILLPWTDDYIYDYFNPRDPVVGSIEDVGEAYGGLDHFKVVVSHRKGYQSLEALRTLDEFQDRISKIVYKPESLPLKLERTTSLLLGSPKKLPSSIENVLGVVDKWGGQSPVKTFGGSTIVKATSLVDFVKYINKQLNETGYPTLPDSDQAYTYILQNFLGEVFHQYRDDLFNDTLSTVAIDVMMNSTDSRVHQYVYEEVIKASKAFPDLEVNVGGFPMKWLVYKDHVVSTKLLNILQVFLLVGAACLITFSIVHRSVFKGITSSLIVLMPVFIGIFWVMGIMYLLGIRLNIPTATISAIGVGVGVNFAVHLVYSLQKTTDREEWKTTLNSIFLNLLTSLAFLFLMGSQIKSVELSGLLMGISVTVAFILTILLVPVFLPGISNIEQDSKYG